MKELLTIEQELKAIQEEGNKKVSVFEDYQSQKVSFHEKEKNEESVINSSVDKSNFDEQDINEIENKIDKQILKGNDLINASTNDLIDLLENEWLN